MRCPRLLSTPSAAAGLLMLGLLLVSTASTASAQTGLTVGNVQIIAVNQTTNSFSFVVWKELPASTSIRFTDFGYDNPNTEFAANSGDGFITWTSSTMDVTPIGTVVVVENNVPDYGTVIVAGGFGGLNLSAEDQIFAFSAPAPNLIYYGISIGSSWAADGATITAEVSNLPDSLSNAFVTAHFDAAAEVGGATYIEYLSPRTVLGSFGRYRLLALNGVNYSSTTVDTGLISLSSTDFAVGENVAPSLLVTAGGLSIPSGGVVFAVLADEISDLELLITVQDLNLDRVSTNVSISRLRDDYGVDLDEWSLGQADVPFALEPMSGTLLRNDINHEVVLTATDEFGGETSFTFTIRVGTPGSNNGSGGCATGPDAGNASLLLAGMIGLLGLGLLRSGARLV